VGPLLAVAAASEDHVDPLHVLERVEAGVLEEGRDRLLLQHLGDLLLQFLLEQWRGGDLLDVDDGDAEGVVGQVLVGHRRVGSARRGGQCEDDGQREGCTHRTILSRRGRDRSGDRAARCRSLGGTTASVPSHSPRETSL
jgi:hypothetical protein